MPGNKRLPRRQPRNATDLAKEGKTAPTRRSSQARARELADEVHRLEVAIVATQRLAREHRVRNANILPAPERQSRSRGFGPMTYVQKRNRRHRFYLQGAQFLVTFSLVAGAGAWLFKLWHSLP